MRNIEKTIAEGEMILEQNDSLDITVEDVKNIADRYQLPKCDDLINIISDCYLLGLAVGVKEGAAL